MRKGAYPRLALGWDSAFPGRCSAQGFGGKARPLSGNLIRGGVETAWPCCCSKWRIDGKPISAKERGFSLIELLIVIAIIGILAVVAVLLMRYYTAKAHYAVVVSECNKVYKAFSLFYMDNEMYPNASSNPAFNLVSFNPLRSQGYYNGNITDRLRNGRADSYDSPDDQGSNQEFWLQLTLDADPNIRFVVADSDNAPLGGGQWLEGVYVFRNGVLSPP